VVAGMEIVAIGDRDTVIGFKLAGVSSAFEVDDPESAKRILRDVFQMQNVGVVIITEKLADQIRAFIERLTESADLPILIEVPDKTGPKGGPDPIQALIKKAVGIEIKI